MRKSLPISKFEWAQPAVRVSFGVGAIERVGDEIAALGCDRVLIVGTQSARAAVERARATLRERHASTIPTVRPHVPAEDVAAAVELFQRSGADGLLAIGGGSAIGLAKAIALRTAASMVAVPTTYSGSEMTSIYGTTDATGKHTGRDERVRPSVVIYDPTLTVALPPVTTASSGVNALAHCVEALYAPDGSPVTALSATEGTRKLARSLPLAVRRPEDLEARGEALLGAFFGGWALGATTMGLHHRVCHVLGGSFGMAHGLAHAVMLPYVAGFNGGAAGARLAPVTDFAGTDLTEGLKAFVSDLGLPTTLPEIGFAPREIGAAATLVASTPIRGPRPISEADVVGVLEAACSVR